MLYITGDTHGERGIFQYAGSAIERNLTAADTLFVCGDWGYLGRGTEEDNEFLDFLAKKPYRIAWVDGNHENFDLLDTYPVETWCGGKVHIIRRDDDGQPKIIHLMRGQVFEVEKKKIFTFGGGYSKDKDDVRVPHVNWWPQEMPTDEEMKEAIRNLERCGNKVDYIVTHAAPEDTMNLFYPDHKEEKPLNNFLEWVRESVEYKHWWFGHLHFNKDLKRNQTVLWFELRLMKTNEVLYDDEILPEDVLPMLEKLGL